MYYIYIHKLQRYSQRVKWNEEGFNPVVCVWFLCGCVGDKKQGRLSPEDHVSFLGRMTLLGWWIKVRPDRSAA